MEDPKRIYEYLLDYCSRSNIIERISIGLVWTVCQTRQHDTLHSGLAMTPVAPTRTLKWPGTLAGKPLKDVAQGIMQWEPYQATAAMAAINCSINQGSDLPDCELLAAQKGSANLTVFDYFLPLIQNLKVVVIGHYPGIEHYVEQYGWQVLERTPVTGDLPDPACEFILAEADWVFLSASSLVNKTFPRLAELAQSAKTVLMGPTLPWLPELYQFGIDYLAGVEVVDPHALYQTAAEGGGVRIFETGVRYKVLALSEDNNLLWFKKKIAATYTRKQTLTQAMDQWYSEGNINRFSEYDELSDINHLLSLLDSGYKTLWDQQQSS